MMMAAAAPAAQKFSGQLDPAIKAPFVMNMSLGIAAMMHLQPASDTERAALPSTAGKDDQVFYAKANLFGASIAVLAVKRPGVEMYAYITGNRDGQFAADQKVVLVKDPQSKDPDYPYYVPVTVDVPAGLGRFKGLPLPLEFGFEPPRGPGAAKPSLSMAVTQPSVSGHLVVDGKEVLVQFFIAADAKTIDPRNCLIGVDGNQDGQIDAEGMQTVELLTASGTPAVFHVGNHYLAITSVDVNSGQVEAEERPSSDYPLIEWTIGGAVPDFTFTDFAGMSHKLSDFRGKFVLLDFWGTWCGPCRSETETIQKFYGPFHDRGLVIIGMDVEAYAAFVQRNQDSPTPNELEDGFQKAKAYVDKQQCPWIQAKQESIQEIARDRFRIHMFPSILVIGPDSKIVGMNWPENMIKEKLEKILPAK
jgi:thiol-disulfide isomerase/thioredoxin